MFIVVVYFIIGSVRKLLDMPSYMEVTGELYGPAALTMGKETPVPIV
jgi:hypothetical protein